MADNSELLIENEKGIPENSEKETEKNEEKQEANEEVASEKPAARTRGRPAGSKDNKPRIKRVPVQQPPPQQQQEAAAEATTLPKKPRKRSRFDTRKTSHSQKSQKSSPRLQNHHALCTGSVCNPRPHKDDS